MAEASAALSEAASILTGPPAQPDPEPEAALPESDPPAPEAEPSAAEPDAAKPDPDAEPEAPDAGKPMTLKALAEKSELTVKELYAVEIPLGDDGSTVTLGEFKNRVKDLKQVDGLLARSEVDIASAEREIMVQRDALTIAHARAGLSEADLTEAANARASYVSRETALAMLAIPSWRDSAIADTERLMIATELSKSGFSPVEIDNYVDHRNLALVRRLVRLEKLVKGAGKEELKPSRPQKPAGQRKSAVKTVDKILADHKAGKLSQNAAVTALLTS